MNKSNSLGPDPRLVPSESQSAGRVHGCNVPGPNLGDWSDVDVEAVMSSVTWWHGDGDGDRNCPFSAAQRLVDRLPRARLIVWTRTGHLTAYRHEPEILDELLARARPVVAAS